MKPTVNTDYIYWNVILLSHVFYCKILDYEQNERMQY